KDTMHPHDSHLSPVPDAAPPFAADREPMSQLAESPATDPELASVIILCCNALEYTKMCLESVFRFTRAPYELIVVDNGSTDDTPAYLQEISTRPGPARVQVIRNALNRGFPVGCNQALAQA